MNTVHGNDAEVLAQFRVVAVLVSAPQKYSVVNSHGSQLAGADTKEGVSGRTLLRRRIDFETFAGAGGPEETQPGGIEIALPGLGTDHVAEKGIAPLLFQLVDPRLLVVAPAAREFIGAPERVKDDRAVLQPGSDNGVTPVLEGCEECVEFFWFDIHRSAARRSW